MKFKRIIGVTDATGDGGRARVLGTLEIEAENEEQFETYFRILCRNPIVWGLSEEEYNDRLKVWADEEAEKARQRVIVVKPDLKIAAN